MKALAFSVVGLALFAAMAARMTAADATNAPRGRVLYNLDCTEFFVGTFGTPVPKTIDKFVDDHAAAGVTDLSINVNAQCTNYRSGVWESFWDGYDPNAGDDQPFFAAIEPKRRAGPDAFEAQMYKNMRSLSELGCDYPKRMIERARRDGVRPWISLRMNDAHEPDRPTHPLHSEFWRSHPQWHLRSGPNPAVGGWGTGGLDYEPPEVREHYMKLIKEVCDRYDLDGLELDFLRFEFYFRPGRQHEGAKLMHVFIEEVRATTQEAAKRWGHPVQLAVRVPTTPWIARMRGLDAVAWAKAGFVDLIIASPFWDSADSDIPMETWKGMLAGADVTLAVSQEDGVNSGSGGRRTMKPEEVRGVLLSGLNRGADAVYFFNVFTSPYQSWPRDVYYQVLKDAGSREALAALPRRHPITIKSPWNDGEPLPSSVLPYTGKLGLFRIHIGPKPQPKQKTCIELTVDGDEPLDVRLNGVPCQAVQGRRHMYAAPPDAASDGYNLIEVIAKQDVRLTWVAISVE